MHTNKYGHVNVTEGQATAFKQIVNYDAILYIKKYLKILMQ